MSTPDYPADSTVLAFNANQLYDATVLRVQKREAGLGYQYLVHYKGYPKKFDEWLEGNKILPVTPGNVALAEKLRLAEQQRLGAGAGGGPGSSSDGGAATDAGAGDGGQLTGKKRKLDALRETVDDAGDGATVGKIRLSLPHAVKVAVCEDWEMVHTRGFIPRLPVPAPGRTAAGLVEDYLAYLRGEEPAQPSTAAAASSKGGSGAGAGAGSGAKAKGKAGSGSGSAATATATAPTASTSAAAAASSDKAKLVSSTQYKAIKEVLEALLSYFDSSFPVYCLYRFERPAFDAWFRDRRHETPQSVAAAISGGSSSSGSGAAVVAEELPLSQLAGAEHFLRLFMRMPELLSQVQASKDETDLIVAVLSDFLKWMARNPRALFDASHYFKTSPEYQAKYADYVGSSSGSSGGSSGAGAGGALKGMMRIPFDKVFLPVTPLHG